MEIDFKQLNQDLKQQINLLLIEWLPGGKTMGREYMCASIRGGRGDSMRVNTETGVWADFATNDRGGDLISLYAAIEGRSQYESAKILLEKYNTTNNPPESKPKPEPKPEKIKSVVIKSDSNKSDLENSSSKWKYTDKEGKVLFCISRYETTQGKSYTPWTLNADKVWVRKGYPAPRPLYNLKEIHDNPDKYILIVEGEKAADAAKQLVGSAYVVTTWSGGAQSWGRNNWKPIWGRNILIWPDADEIGISVSDKIGKELQKYCPEVKIINPEDQAKGWDAADAVNEEWDWNTFKIWAKARIKLCTALTKPEVQEVKRIHVEDLDIYSESTHAIWEKLGVIYTTNGQPVYNITNCMRILNGLPAYKDRIWFDEFHRKIFTNIPNKNSNGSIREWADIDDLNMAHFFQEVIGLLRISDDMCNKALRIFANNDTRNEPKDWMNSLEWDGTPRIDTFFIDCLGSKDSEYTRSVSKNFWISMVSRIFRPGCQVDNMVVLEGPQGSGKTTSLRIIGGNWHIEALENITTNNFFQALHGKLIVEIGELSAFPKAEIQRIKQVVSCNKDRYRAPYDRAPADHSRMSVFVGTTNESKYLHDSTGGRRFWPIKCGYINNDLIHKNREQLFAEAVSRSKNNEPWHIMPVSSTLAEQESRHQADEWEFIIGRHLKFKDECNLADVAKECLGVDLARLDMSVQRRISGILKRLGWRNVVSDDSNDVSREWIGPEEEVKQQDEFEF